jgi:hypothetical protein
MAGESDIEINMFIVIKHLQLWNVTSLFWLSCIAIRPFKIWTIGILKIPSSGMWRRTDLVWTDVSDERIASIFGVEKSASEEPTWAGDCRLSHQSKTPSYIRTGREAEWLADFSTMKMDAMRSSEMSVHTRSTRRHIPEDGILHCHRRKNLKSYDPNIVYY